MCGTSHPGARHLNSHSDHNLVVVPITTSTVIPITNSIAIPTTTSIAIPTTTSTVILTEGQNLRSCLPPITDLWALGRSPFPRKCTPVAPRSQNVVKPPNSGKLANSHQPNKIKVQPKYI